MKYDFDSMIDRHNTNSFKWDYVTRYYNHADILPMWVADMDFKSPPAVIEALRRIVDFGIFGYSGTPPSFYEAVSGWMKKRHGWEVNKEWITLSPGVVPALHVLVNAFSEPGDQVILQTPVYYPFFDAVKAGGREILDNPLRLEGEQYVMDLADLESKITSRTKMMILCNPHNPISRVWRREELRALGELCFRHNIVMVSDEIHSDIVYTGFSHVPFPLAGDGLAERTVVCTAASKTFNLPGLQTSSIIISNGEMKKRFAEAMRRGGVPSPGMFGVAATEAAYCYGEDWLMQLLSYLEGNVAFVRKYLKENIPGASLAQPQGTYLLWLDFSNCGVPGDRQDTFIRDIARVALEPGWLFGCKEKGRERMNIACPRALLEQGLEKIAGAVRQLRQD